MPTMLVVHFSFLMNFDGIRAVSKSYTTYCNHKSRNINGILSYLLLINTVMRSQSSKLMREDLNGLRRYVQASLT